MARSHKRENYVSPHTLLCVAYLRNISERWHLVEEQKQGHQEIDIKMLHQCLQS